MNIQSIRGSMVLGVLMMLIPQLSHADDPALKLAQKRVATACPSAISSFTAGMVEGGKFAVKTGAKGSIFALFTLMYPVTLMYPGPAIPSGTPAEIIRFFGEQWSRFGSEIASEYEVLTKTSLTPACKVALKQLAELKQRRKNTLASDLSPSSSTSAVKNFSETPRARKSVVTDHRAESEIATNSF